jgi:hypothetical protein
MRDDRGYELLVMLMTMGFGFLEAPWWMALMSATFLMLATLEAHGRVQPRLVRAVSVRLAGAADAAPALTGLALAASCFACGRGLAWLLAG